MVVDAPNNECNALQHVIGRRYLPSSPRALPSWLGVMSWQESQVSPSHPFRSPLWQRLGPSRRSVGYQHSRIDRDPRERPTQCLKLAERISERRDRKGPKRARGNGEHEIASRQLFGKETYSQCSRCNRRGADYDEAWSDRYVAIQRFGSVRRVRSGPCQRVLMRRFSRHVERAR